MAATTVAAASAEGDQSPPPPKAVAVVPSAELLAKNAASALRFLRKAIVASAARCYATKKPPQLFESGQLLLTVGLAAADPSSLRKSSASSSILVTLPHRVHCPATESGLLITKDLPGAPADYEATGGHFADLLRASGCHEGLTVLPLRELTVAYMPYEAKRRLCHAYDYFLGDRRICHRLGNKLGGFFLTKNRRKLPIPVNLEARSLADEIDKARRTARICLTGSTVSCLVGRVDEAESTTEDKQLLENILSACDQLFQRLPGITGIYLRHQACGNIPLFVAEAGAPVTENLASAAKKADRKIDLDRELADLGETLWDKNVLGKLQRKAKAGKRSASGKVDKRSASNKVEKRSASGKVEKRSASGKVEKRSASGKVEKRSASGKVEKRQKQKKISSGGKRKQKRRPEPKA